MREPSIWHRCKRKWGQKPLDSNCQNCPVLQSHHHSHFWRNQCPMCAGLHATSARQMHRHTNLNQDIHSHSNILRIHSLSSRMNPTHNNLHQGHYVTCCSFPLHYIPICFFDDTIYHFFIANDVEKPPSHLRIFDGGFQHLICKI